MALDRWCLGALVALAGGLALVLMISRSTTGSSDSPTMRAATETLLTLLALGCGWLLRSRFRQTDRQSDLLLAVAVFAFAFMHASMRAIPAAFEPASEGSFAGPAACGELLVAALLATAAFGLREPSRFGLRHADGLLLASSSGIVGVAAVAALLLHGFLIGGHSPSGAAGPVRGLGLAVTLMSAALFALAAVGFRRHRSARGDGGTCLLAGAAMILAAAVLPELSAKPESDPGSAANALQMLAFGMIAVAGMRWQIRARTLTTRAAALAERQRIARDLHDGLAQDLALIAAQGEQIARDVGTNHPIVGAARRALQISRCAIAELSDPDAADIHEALEVIATELRQRFSIAIVLDVQVAGELSSGVREAVSRISREAIANAARHGGAKNVVVSLHAGERVRLRVLDDGCGIESTSGCRPDEGFGLRSIRERATALGGYMSIRQVVGGGTVLDVVLS